MYRLYCLPFPWGEGPGFLLFVGPGSPPGWKGKPHPPGGLGGGLIWPDWARFCFGFPQREWLLGLPLQHQLPPCLCLVYWLPGGQSFSRSAGWGGSFGVPVTWRWFFPVFSFSFPGLHKYLTLAPAPAEPQGGRRQVFVFPGAAVPGRRGFPAASAAAGPGRQPGRGGKEYGTLVREAGIFLLPGAVLPAGPPPGGRAGRL